MRRVTALLAAVLTLAGACGSPPATAVAPEPTATVISAARLMPGQAVPAPAGKAVVTMTGKILVTNQGGALVFDCPTIEQLGVRQVGVFEPWVKKNLEFRGIWLQDLLAVAGVAPDATGLRIVALDDYVVDLTLAEVQAGGIMLATRTADGSAIPIDEGGPTRIVFLGGVKAGAVAQQWVWSVKSIEVR